MGVPSDLLPSLVGVAVLTVIGVTVLIVFRVPDPSAPAWAILRGAVQLAAISFVLSGIISNPFWIAAALAVMFVVASTVAAHRVGWSWTVLAQTGLAILAGAATTMLVVFGTGALELTARFALAIGAIIIGNAMSVATLTGRNFTTAVVDHWDEVEGWLAVGATPRQSTVHLARRAIRDALVPSIDQTKTTGLVVLPGAFVGAIFGGLSPLEAGRFQIVVLAGILATGTSPHR
ncbi:ABC transporter permease [Microbacterium fluvii]